MALRFAHPYGAGIALILFLFSVTAGPVFGSSQSFTELTRKRIDQLRQDELPKLRSRLGTFGKKDLAEYGSALRRYVEALPDSTARKSGDPGDMVDRLGEVLESYQELEARVRDSRENGLESVDDLTERAREGSDEISDRELADEWFERVRASDRTNGLLDEIRSVITLGVVHTGYTLRSNPRYRADLLMQYLDFLFPSVAGKFLRDHRASDVTRSTYRGLISLTYEELRNLENPSGIKRSFTNLLRDHGRVLREVGRGGRGSPLLSRTLEDIDRVGRQLAGVTDADSRYPFLDQ